MTWRSAVQATGPYWESEVEGGGAWGPTATLKITVTYTDALAPLAEYYFKIVIPSGISAQDFYSTR